MTEPSTEAFGADTSADEVLSGLDLSGKLALVTGGSSGLGAETARALAAAGARLIITARDVAKGEKVAAGIREATGNTAVEVEALELGSLASCRDFAGRILQRGEGVQILVNNAGIMACPYDRTEDGFELQFGSNHLGHFLLTCLLVPALLQGAPARVVNLSSRAHHTTGVDFDDIQFEHRDYDKWVSYGQSKTANILFSVELERRLSEQGVHVYAVHPGVIHTELSRHMDPADFEQLFARAAARGEKLKAKSIPAGAATSVFAATAPELEGRGGLYLEDCGVATINDDANAVCGVRSYAVDAELAARLWSVSEGLVGQEFNW